MDSYSGRFAKRLRKLREDAGLTVAEVVERMSKQGVEISDKTYYHWEGSRSDPKLDFFPVIAKALKVKNTQDLFPKR